MKNMAHRPDHSEDWATLGLLIIVLVLGLFEAFYNVGVQIGSAIGAGMH